MSLALFTAHALSILVGITIGLFGGGGAILMVPILSYVAAWPTEQAVTGSLFIVGVTSLFSTALHARRPRSWRRIPTSHRDRGTPAGDVRWSVGLAFGALAMLGAFIGGQLTALLPPVLVMTIFAVVMIGSGVGMVRKKKPYTATTAQAHTTTQKLKILFASLGIGVISGLVGAGGGFLVVPALALIVGFPMPAAVGTSLLVVAMQSASGFFSHMLTVEVDWPSLVSLTVLAMVGTIGGTLLGSRISAQRLKRGFGVFVLFMAVFVLAQEYVIG